MSLFPFNKEKRTIREYDRLMKRISLYTSREALREGLSGSVQTARAYANLVGLLDEEFGDKKSVTKKLDVLFEKRKKLQSQVTAINPETIRAEVGDLPDPRTCKREQHRLLSLMQGCTDGHYLLQVLTPTVNALRDEIYAKLWTAEIEKIVTAPMKQARAPELEF